MRYYAHTSDKKPWQTMSEHLNSTAMMTAEFSSAFNAGEWGYCCGLFHDLGKYSHEFQKKLTGSPIKVDHSSAGGQEACKLFGPAVGKLVAYCISGHHSGLLDHGTPASTEGTLYSRLHSSLKDYTAYLTDQELLPQKQITAVPITPVKKNPGFSIAFFVRMLYSCLVDADFLDTEKYMAEGPKYRGGHASLEELKYALDEVLARIQKTDTIINTKRTSILKSCISRAQCAPGLFTLTVPTGGGKTYSSLAFALHHALHNQMRRIIYVIPYTSIIEQNAQVFKSALGEENVLEHHSNFSFGDFSEDETSSLAKLKLSAENWDIPIVVTTNVQFFESLFANRSSRCRKIHNISRSVVILDEAQMLPVDYLRPSLSAVTELVSNYGSSVVMCTATQPAIGSILADDITPVELVGDPRKLYEEFKKVTVSNLGEVEDEELARIIRSHPQVLCIVNTRKHARAIFNKVDEGGNAFHLSTLMCAAHRKKVLAEIKERLKKGASCRVVSTQLIEAGVDVDFPVVYRALSGVDSIIQSAGRCNREGKLKEGYVYVFKPLSEHAKLRGYLATTAALTEEVLRHYSDPISLDAIDYYFRQLYALHGNLDKNKIIECFEAGYKSLEFDFQEAANKFRLIESPMVPIVIPFNEEAKKLINEARFSNYFRSLARKLQTYTVSIYQHEFNTLLRHGLVSTVNGVLNTLNNQEWYDAKRGLFFPEDTSGEGIFL